MEALCVDGQGISWPGGLRVDSRVRAPAASPLFARRRRSRDAGPQRPMLVPEEEEGEGEEEGMPAPEPEVAVPGSADAVSQWGAGGEDSAAISSDDEVVPSGGAGAHDAAVAARKAQRLEKFHEAVDSAFQELAAEGIPWLPITALTLGAEISRGAFGIVRDAVAHIDGEPVVVAVKSLPARLRRESYVETLHDFQSEVRMGWLASWKGREGKRTTRVLRIFGVAYDYTRRGQRVRLRIGARVWAHIHVLTEASLRDALLWRTSLSSATAGPRSVMERVNCDGDVHDEIHSENHWVCLREAGKDTGVSVRNHFVTVDGHDVWAYVMERELKLRLGLDLARALRELERARVIHRDIKPSNMLLHAGPKERPGLLLKLMDFGEAAPLEEAGGYAAGTPGYMAPEVEVDGNASVASDVFSVGVTLLELWVGSIGSTFDEYEGIPTGQVGAEPLRTMRREMVSVLAKLEKADAEIGGLLRRCCADEPHRRPSPKQLVHSFKRLNGLRPGAKKARSRWKKTGLAVAAAHRLGKTKH